MPQWAHIFTLMERYGGTPDQWEKMSARWYRRWQTWAEAQPRDQSSHPTTDTSGMGYQEWLELAEEEWGDPNG